MLRTDILILGAGCSGTSLAHHLEAAGFKGSVALCDSRSSFKKEQRWCTWGRIPDSLEHLVKHRWNEWSVVGESGEVVNRGGDQYYSEIYAPEFFKSLHEPWLDGSSGTKLHLGEEVIETRPVREGTVVVTNEREWLAKLVFDARFHGSPKTARLKEGARTFLHQTFLGWKIAFPRAVFNPGRVILMDFRVRSKSGLNFMYVLPYSETEALVESTCFDSSPLSWNRHISQVQEYILENFGDDYWIEGEESGNLPMSSKHVRNAVSRNFLAIGAAGGAIRPSSGYAFHRIQRTTKALADRVVAGEPLTRVSPSPLKYRFFDNVFLDVVGSDLAGATVHFERMFKRTPPSSLVKFMLDEGGILDDARVVMSLPKMPFFKEFFLGLFGLRRLFAPVAAAYEKVGAALWGAVGRSAHRSSVRQIDR